MFLKNVVVYEIYSKNLHFLHVSYILNTSHGIFTCQIFNGFFYFSFLYHCQDFYRTWLYIWVTWQVSYKKQKLLTLSQHMGSPPVFVEVRVAHLVGFLCCIFGFVCLRPVSLCTQCCQSLWIVHSWLLLRFSLMFMYTVIQLGGGHLTLTH
jgi:hypothetical protein